MSYQTTLIIVALLFITACSSPEKDFDASVEINTIEAYTAHIKKFPDSIYKEMAEKSIEILTLEKKIKDPAADAQKLARAESMALDFCNTKDPKYMFSLSDISASTEGKPCTLTLEGLENGQVKYYTEFPHDRFAFNEKGAIEIMSDKSIHRIKGKVTLSTHTYAALVNEGDSLHRLTFGILKEKGYVYLRGKGKVLYADGTQKKLGY